jgi:hypothetical protein
LYKYNSSTTSQLICSLLSPEDQATLEAEYRQNPKPDKAARMEILKKVSLGGKEVQVRNHSVHEVSGQQDVQTRFFVGDN